MAKIQAWVDQTFQASHDPEAQDCVTFCECFSQRYSDASAPNQLQIRFENLKQRIAQMVGWAPAALNNLVEALPGRNQVIELTLAPWALELMPVSRVSHPWCVCWRL